MMKQDGFRGVEKFTGNLEFSGSSSHPGRDGSLGRTMANGPLSAFRWNATLGSREEAFLQNA